MLLRKQGCGITARHGTRFWEVKEPPCPWEKNEVNLLDRKMGKVLQAKGTVSTKAQEHLTSSRNKSFSWVQALPGGSNHSGDGSNRSSWSRKIAARDNNNSGGCCSPSAQELSTELRVVHGLCIWPSQQPYRAVGTIVPRCRKGKRLGKL